MCVAAVEWSLWRDRLSFARVRTSESFRAAVALFPWRERIGEHDGERVARSTVANCAEPFGLRVTVSCLVMKAAAQGDSLDVGR